MKYYYYLAEGKGFIRIKEKRKPTARRTPYLAREFDGLKWVLPSFPQISFGRLSELRFIGSELVPAAEE